MDSPQKAVLEGNAIVFLDGLDLAFSDRELSVPTAKFPILSRQYGNCRSVISSRPGSFED